MFVVHTLNQLEEAVRAGAGEILVTGGLASNVREVYVSRPGQDAAAPVESGYNAGVSLWRVASLMVVTDQYAILDTQLDSHSPCMILQRTTHH